MSNTSQVCVPSDGATSSTPEGQSMTFSATFIVKVVVCQTFHEDRQWKKIAEDKIQD